MTVDFHFQAVEVSMDCFHGLTLLVGSCYVVLDNCSYYFLVGLYIIRLLLYYHRPTNKYYGNYVTCFEEKGNLNE